MLCCMIPLPSCLFFLPLLHSCFLTISLMCVCVCSFLERPNQIGELSEIWRAGWFYWAGGVMKLITASQHLQVLCIYPRSHANANESLCLSHPPTFSCSLNFIWLFVICKAKAFLSCQSSDWTDRLERVANGEMSMPHLFIFHRINT